MKNKFLKTLAGIGAALCVSASAQAVVIFSDDFNGYAGGSGGGPDSMTNWPGSSNWIINSGSVDLVANGDWGLFCPENSGKCIDLDGSTSDSADLRTTLLTFQAGVTYRVQFDLSGNQRVDTDETVRINVWNGNDFSEVVTLAYNSGWQHFSFDFIGNGNNSRLAFRNMPWNGGDNIGAMLDNVSIETVPEPGILGIFGLGMLGLGLAARRRRRA